MSTRTLITVAALLCLSAAAYGKPAAPVQVTVADPFIELHTGPGRGYPVFFVAERGEQVQVLLRRTDWFEVRTAGGKQGWVSEDQLGRTLDPDGRPPDLGKATWDDFARHRWEVSIELGSYGGASEVVGTVGYRLTPNFTAELAVADVTGNFSSDLVVALHLLNAPFPEWRVTPFVMLEGGVIHTNPNATIVSTQDRTDAFAGAGAGLRAYVTRRFIVRAEYSGYVIFTSRNDNERVEEWKAGFTYFF